MARMIRIHGVDHQPDDAFGGHVLLEFLHRARFEMVGAERAIQVVGFQHDNFAGVIGEANDFAVNVRG